MKNKWLQLPYEFSGLFYQEGDQKCRRVLEIREIGYEGNCDLIVIMMNPGGSYPIDKEFQFTGIKEANFVATYPDITQWKVIEFMRQNSSKYAQVFNLSDICKTKLRQEDKDLFENFSIFKTDIKYINEHFDNGEFKNVLIGWGASPMTKDTIGLAVGFLISKQKVIYGYRGLVGNYFYHPLMRPSKANVLKPWIEGVKIIDLKPTN